MKLAPKMNKIDNRMNNVLYKKALANNSYFKFLISFVSFFSLENTIKPKPIK